MFQYAFDVLFTLLVTVCIFNFLGARQKHLKSESNVTVLACYSCSGDTWESEFPLSVEVEIISSAGDTGCKNFLIQFLRCE